MSYWDILDASSKRTDQLKQEYNVKTKQMSQLNKKKQTASFFNLLVTSHRSKKNMTKSAEILIKVVTDDRTKNNETKLVVIAVGDGLFASQRHGQLVTSPGCWLQPVTDLAFLVRRHVLRHGPLRFVVEHGRALQRVPYFQPKKKTYSYKNQ